MADNTIDTLELQIISNSNKAENSLDSLAKKLLEVNRSFAALNGGGLRKYAKEIGRVGAAVKAFSNIKIKMPEISGATKEVDRMEEYVKNASKRISQTLSDSLNLKGANTKGITNQIQEIGKMLSSGKALDASYAVDSLGEDIIQIAKNVKCADDEMQAFYQTLLKTNKIKVSADLPKSMPDEWKNMDGLLRQKMSTKTGTELDSLMQEWKGQFKGLFSSLDTDTVEDQFIALNNLVKQCREGITDPLATSGLLEDSVWEQICNELGKFQKEIENTKSVLESTGGTKVTENIGLDKFISDLGKVSRINVEGLSGIGESLSDLALGIGQLNGLSLNIKPITQVISALEGLGKKKNVANTENLKQISNNIQEFSNSINSVGNLTQALTSLSNINFDSNNLSKVIKSLQGLLSIQNTDFNTQAFSDITAGIQQLSNIPDVSGSLNRFITSLQKLANSGGSISAVASKLPDLGEALRTTVNRMASARNISDSVNLFTQSIGRLAFAGEKTEQTAAGLDNLAQETLKFFQAMTKAPKISQNTLKMTQALAQLASAGGKVSTATGTITSSFNKLSGLGSKTASAIKKAAKGISSSLSQIGSSSKHLNTASFSFGKLLKSALPFIGFREIFNWGKQAVETASSLTEVQNVVDVAFGDMKQKMEDFASTSIEDFGMSELTAKQIASRYQAMGNAIDIPIEKFSQVSDVLKKNNAVYGESVDSMADMSIELTKLAADMASFYDVNQEDVARNLYAVFTGEQEPLRKYGLDLTQATVQEWALKQGLDADMQSMTQAEKALLRYQYVMSNSTAAMHDFQRTQDSWANQTRILSQRFQELGSVVGGTLINALKPLVKALNSVMGKVIEFARTVSEALGAIFGWKIEINTGGIANDLDSAETSAGDLADSADDAAGGFGDATGAAQKLKKTLSVLPFDELNQLASNLSNTGNGNSGSGSGSGGLDDSGVNAGAGASANLVQTDSLFERYKSEIETLEELGEYIGDALIKAMQSIDWESVYESARNFGTGLADFLNGLISPELFGETGRLIANSLNTALYVLNSFGERFDFSNFGLSIATGLNKFFRNFKFGLLADTIDTWANGLLVAMDTGVNNLEWDTIGKRIANAIKKTLKGINWETAYSAANGFGSGLAKFLNRLITPSVFGELGSTVAKSVNTILKSAHSFLEEATWTEWGNAIGTGINDAIGEIDIFLLADGISNFVVGILSAIKSAIESIEWHGVGQKIADMLSAIDWAGIASGLFDAGLALINGLLQAFGELPMPVQIAAGALSGLFVAAQGFTIFQQITGAISGGTGLIKSLISLTTTLSNPVVLAIAGVIAAGVLIIANWDKIKEAAGKLGEWISQKWEAIKTKTSEVWGNIKDFISATWSNLTSWAKEKFTSIQTTVSTIWDNMKTKASTIWTNIKTSVSGVWTNLKTSASTIFNSIKTTVGGVWDSMKTSAFSIWDSIKTKITGIASGIKKTVSETFEKLKTSVSSVFDGVVSTFKTPLNAVIGAFNGIIRVVNGVISKINSISFKITVPDWIPGIGGSWWGFSGFNIPSVSSIPYLASGGLITAPTLAVMGEAFKQEAVLPLENKRTMSMIADSIVSSSSGMGVDEEIMMNAVARGVTMAMMNNQQNSGVPEYIQNDLYLNGDMMARAVTKSKDSIDYRFNPTPQF